MTNREVFRAFAAGLEAVGGSVASRAFGDVVALYSYGTPIALRDPSRAAAVTVWDARTYSPTTVKQRSMAQAVCGGAFVLDHDAFRDRCREAGVDLTGAR